MKIIPPGNLKNTLLVYFTPALLCGVACIQIYLARTASLSPWKGGGFGMFSTVDSPAARFIRVFIITDEGEVPVQVPASLNAKKEQLQTLPSTERLRFMAEYMAHAVWAPDSGHSPLDRYRDLSRGTSGSAGLQSDKIRIDPDKSISLRMLDPNEPISGSVEPLKFKRVRAELWGYKFDSHATKLRAAKLLEVAVDSRNNVN